MAKKKAKKKKGVRSPKGKTKMKKK